MVVPRTDAPLDDRPRARSLGYSRTCHRAPPCRKVAGSRLLTFVRLGVAAACAMNLMFLHGALYAA